MTDSEYWSIAGSLPRYNAPDGTVVLDWHSQLPNCPPDPMACVWVRGYNPIQNCWIDPGAQYATPPSPYPSASSWGVSLCNPPITQPPASGGGGSTSTGGGSGTTFPPCSNNFMLDPSQISQGVAEDLSTQKACKIPSNLSLCKTSQILVSGKTWTKYDCSQSSAQQNTDSNPGFSLNIPTWVYIAGAGLLLFMFLKR